MTAIDKYFLVNRIIKALLARDIDLLLSLLAQLKSDPDRRLVRDAIADLVRNRTVTPPTGKNHAADHPANYQEKPSCRRSALTDSDRLAMLTELISALFGGSILDLLCLASPAPIDDTKTRTIPVFPNQYRSNDSAVRQGHQEFKKECYAAPTSEL